MLRSTQDSGAANVQLTDAVRQTVERLSAMGVEVFVVDEVPFPAPFEPEQFARTLWLGAPRPPPGVSVSAHQSRIDALAPAFAQLPVRHISLQSYLCPDGAFCPAIMDGYSNYFDDSHLSQRGAARVVPAFVDALNQIGPAR
jgi:hypothetical protein